MTFIPTGTIETHGDTGAMDARKLPDGVLAARFFVPPCVGKDRRVSLEDLAKLVKQLAPGMPFVSQAGVFRLGKGEVVADAEAAQVAFVDIEARGRERFLEAMRDVATRLSKALAGEWVYGEAQQDGVVKGLLTVSSW